MPWGQEDSSALLRPRPVRAALLPVRERAFVYDRYSAFLDRLDAERFHIVPLRELASTEDASRVVLALRHDVDVRLDAALTFALLEHERGIRSTYFVLHTAGYYGVIRDG